MVITAAWRVLGLCLAGNLWRGGKIAFFEPKVVHQVGDSFVKKADLEESPEY